MCVCGGGQAVFIMPIVAELFIEPKTLTRQNTELVRILSLFPVLMARKGKIA